MCVSGVINECITYLASFCRTPSRPEPQFFIFGKLGIDMIFKATFKNITNFGRIASDYYISNINITVIYTFSDYTILSYIFVASHGVCPHTYIHLIQEFLVSSLLSST